MIDAKLLLPFALAALVAYVADSARRVEVFKRNQMHASKVAFLADKLRRQLVAILLLPGLCLLASHTLDAAFQPATGSGPLARQLSALTGYSGAALWRLLSLQTIGQMLIAVVVLELVSMVRRLKSPISLGDVSALLPGRPLEFALCAGLAMGAGVGEELLFRGFLPVGLESFGVSLACALLVSTIIFGACHLYQGPLGVLATGVAGALLAAAYVMTGSLVFVIIIHVAVDIIGLVIRPLTAIGLRRIVARLGIQLNEGLIRVGG